MSVMPSVVHWFRLDLRLHDNLALRNAINEVSKYDSKVIFMCLFSCYGFEKIYILG